MSFIRSLSSFPIPIPSIINNSSQNFIMDSGNDTPFTSIKHNLINTSSTNNIDEKDKSENDNEMLKSENDHEIINLENQNKKNVNEYNKLCIPILSDIEKRKKKVKYINFEINSYDQELSNKKRKICELEKEMYHIRNIRQKAYEELKEVCPHEWVREKEKIPYGEYYNVCKICNMIQ